VLVITHNMADVQEVAGKAVVLRLGHNNGVFDVQQVSYETIIAAITGAIDSSVTRRAHQHAAAVRQGEEST
jgi:D-xylose transport system ATP-binding protein